MWFTFTFTYDDKHRPYKVEVSKYTSTPYGIVCTCTKPDRGGVKYLQRLQTSVSVLSNTELQVTLF
jgi:hypothetical protein